MILVRTKESTKLKTALVGVSAFLAVGAFASALINLPQDGGPASQQIKWSRIAAPPIPNIDLSQSVGQQQITVASKELHELTGTLISKASTIALNQTPNEISEIQENLIARKFRLGELMRTNPDQALLALLPQESRDVLVKLCSNCLEVPVIVQGKTSLAHYHLQNSDQTINLYRVTTDNDKVYTVHPPLYLENQFLSAQTVTINGYSLDNDLIVDTTQDRPIKTVGTTGSLIDEALAGSQQSMGQQRIAVILAKLSNAPDPKITKQQINDYLFKTVSDYFYDSSLGKTSLVGELFGWYSINFTGDCRSTTDKLIEKIILAADNDIDYRKFNKIFIVGPFMESHCSSTGGAVIGGQTYDVNEGRTLITLAFVAPEIFLRLDATAHELGHTFGMGHANANPETSNTFASWKGEYQDSYEIMGRGFGVINAAHRDYLGWFAKNNITTVDHDGVYTIEPLSDINKGVKALKFKVGEEEWAGIPNSKYLYIDFRQPIGLDQAITPTIPASTGSNVFTGALLYYGGDWRSYLLHAGRPNEDDLWRNALNDGESFRDPSSGALITSIARSKEKMAVQIQMGKTDTTAPKLAITNPISMAVMSKSSPITLTATDNDSGIQKVEIVIEDFDPVTQRYRARTPIILTASPYQYLLDTAQLSNGKKILCATAFDRSGEKFNVAGNTSRKCVSFSVVNTNDSVAPSISFLSPKHLSVFNTYSVPVEIIASDNTNVEKVAVWIDDVLTYSDLTKPPYTFVSSLSPGTHTLMAKAYDPAGNEATTTVTITITMNQQNITLSPITGPLTGLVGMSGDYRFNASISDGSPLIPQVTVIDPHGNTSTITTYTTQNTYTFSVLWKTEGVHQLNALVEDLSKKFFQKTTFTVTISKPALTSSADAPKTPGRPSGYTTIKVGMDHKYVVHAISDPNKDQLKVTFDWGDGTITVTDFKRSGSTFSASHSWSSAGTYLVKTRAIDLNSNESNWSKPLTVRVR